ncbi:MAG: DUF5615 family PIN-like protein [Dehalococcoidia bacterium]
MSEAVVARFYLDENQTSEIAVHGRAFGVDVTSAHEEGMAGRSDAEQLNHAARQGRCLITADYADFTMLTERAAQRGEPHAGILFVTWQVRRTQAHAFALGLQRFAEAHPGGLEPYRIEWAGRRVWMAP